MKLTTFNVNGIRAALGKGLLDWAAEYSPEVLCMQEVRARLDQLDENHLVRFEELYAHQTWNPAVRAGYSGVATLAKTAPLENNLGMGAPHFDNEGRVISTHFPGFLLFNTYFPNGGHDHSRVPYKLDFYAHLLELCDSLHSQGEKIILCGDFNTAHREIDLRNPKENENTSGFLPEERAWIDSYLKHGFVDAYRNLYPEREQYTWWTYRFNARGRGIGWRLDYFLVSESLLDQVQDVIIHEEVQGSDHCPVSLIIDSKADI